ncbi:MAG TPA: 3-methyl-2-oxobutanoate hydroxymethyltransferase [Bryobacteraceae bacterium]|nr:3-methyl-2-oxobutanoate hydroxymethyltransferase [Bryobacteraceae bacterium]
MTESTARRLRVPDLKAMKQRGEKIVMITAYDATMARLLERAGMDVLLVGDSLGMVILGYETTVPVTLEAMIHHTRAVSNAVKRCLVIADMPFLTYQTSISRAMRNAARLIQEGGANAVKLEGGRPIVKVARRLVEAGIPVMGHLGLMPQSVNQLGGFRPQARGEMERRRLHEDALALEEAGAFAVVLESIPPELAEQVTAGLAIPTIGIGAGPQCDGQVLVSHDVLGLSDGAIPPFAKQYARLGEMVVAAAKSFASEVREGIYPAVHASASASHRK